MKIPCPKCGADIIYDVYTEQLYCDTCKCYSQLDEVNLAKIYEFNDTYNEYQCGSCGAKLVTERSTILTECAFCNSTKIITQKIEGEFKPDYIIPFTVSKENFIKKYFEYVNTLNFLPKCFKKEINLKDIKGVYIPYWDFAIDTRIDFKGTVLREKHDKILPRRMKVDYEREEELEIPIDASSNLNNNITSSIEPFDFRKEKKFNPLYLLGFQVEWLDENYNKLEKEVMEKAILHTAKNKSIPRLDATTFYTGKASIDVSYNYKPLLYLLPLWLCNIKYRNKKIPVALNGQTGKIVANFPLNYIKIFLIKLIVFIIGITILYVAFIPYNSLPEDSILRKVFAMFGFLVVLASLVWNAGLRKNYKSIHHSLNSSIRVIKSKFISDVITFDFKKKDYKEWFKRPFILSLFMNGNKQNSRIVKKLIRKSKKEYLKTNTDFYYFTR